MNYFQEDVRNSSLQMTRIKIVFTFIILSFSIAASGQISGLSSALSSDLDFSGQVHELRAPKTSIVFNHQLSAIAKDEFDQSMERSILVRQIPMGWFCRKELILEEKIGLPLRFRLGTYQAAARLEGK